VASACDYYEKYINIGNTIIAEELEKKNDELMMAKQSNESTHNILREHQNYEEELKEELKKFKGVIRRQERELDGIKQNAEGSASQLYTRISILEREIEDLRAQNESLNKALKKAVSEPGVFSKEQSVHSSDTRTSEADLQTIEQRIEYLKQQEVEGPYQGFFKVFEEYKAAVMKEMVKMKKNLQVVKQENDSLKSSNLEMKRKEDQFEKLRRQLEEAEDDENISKKLKDSSLE